MRKAICMAVLFAVGCAVTSQAVVIHWSTDGYDGLGTPYSAQLVYVASGAPTFSFGVLNNGEGVEPPLTGLALTPAGVGEQATTDAATRSSGGYYVVLINQAENQFAYSSTPLAFDNMTAITEDAMAPATELYSPGGFSGWSPIPEPSSAALLCLGAAALALKRRKKG